jgi:hypothetical protein
MGPRQTGRCELHDAYELQLKGNCAPGCSPSMQGDHETAAKTGEGERSPLDPLIPGPPPHRLDREPPGRLGHTTGKGANGGGSAHEPSRSCAICGVATRGWGGGGAATARARALCGASGVDGGDGLARPTVRCARDRCSQTGTTLGRARLVHSAGFMLKHPVRCPASRQPGGLCTYPVAGATLPGCGRPSSWPMLSTPQSSTSMSRRLCLLPATLSPTSLFRLSTPGAAMRWRHGAAVM